MHPVIKLVSVLFMASAAALGGLALLLATLLVLSLWLASPGLSGWTGACKMLKRMRWFFLSILLVYWWFTPGEPLMALAQQAWWMPSKEGISAGALRLLALLTIIMAVSWLLATTTQQELLDAIGWLARPLRWTPISYEQFVVRLTLTLRTVPAVQEKISMHLAQASRVRSFKGLGAALAQVFVEVLQTAEAQPDATLVINTGQGPRLGQWWFPLAVLVLVVAAVILGG